MQIPHSNVIPPGPFDRTPSGKFRFRVLDWMAYMYVRENWKTLGAAQMWSMLNRDRNGKLYLRQMAEFLPIEAFRELSQFGS
jgi:hypothetical protein